MGIGSEKGRGYVIDIHMSTLENVPQKLKGEIQSYAVKMMRQDLQKFFPARKLDVVQDGNLIKLYGDLSLVTV